MLVPVQLRFSLADAEQAYHEWRFNCGPGALCAVLGKTPEEIRPFLGDFEKKGYTNPSLMRAILRGMGVSFREIKGDAYPLYGLVRVQWAGPWTEPGVPKRAAYRHTHWVGIRHRICGREIFDINAVGVGGWLPWDEWRFQFVPWLLKQVEPQASGEWWPTHRLELLGVYPDELKFTY